jgi:hypothetical protein
MSTKYAQDCSLQAIQLSAIIEELASEIEAWSCGEAERPDEETFDLFEALQVAYDNWRWEQKGRG